MVAEGAATAQDVARWEAALERMDRAETRPIVFAPVFFAIGVKPE